MKKKIFCFLIVSFLLVITFNIFSYSKEINEVINFSINLFIKNVFPSLFPMFVISNLLLAIKTPKFLGNIFKDIFYKLFTFGFIIIPFALLHVSFVHPKLFFVLFDAKVV